MNTRSNPTYRTTVNCASKELSFALHPSIENEGVYSPSAGMQSRVKAMWRTRSPSRIGRVTEEMSTEVLNGGKVRLDGTIKQVEARPAGSVLGSTAKLWRLYGGIRSDDLLVVANARERLQVFITECKGTTQARGFSYNTEGKMVYQAARTCELIRKNPSEFAGIELCGMILIEINHHALNITINVTDGDHQGLSGCVPDHWMYRDKGFAYRRE